MCYCAPHNALQLGIDVLYSSMFYSGPISLAGTSYQKTPSGSYEIAIRWYEKTNMYHTSIRVLLKVGVKPRFRQNKHSAKKFEIYTNNPPPSTGPPAY